jgi:hypothetical protein
MQEHFVNIMNLARLHISDSKLQQAVAVLTWWKISKLICRLGDDDEAMLYYSQQVIAKG